MRKDKKCSAELKSPASNRARACSVHSERERERSGEGRREEGRALLGKCASMEIRTTNLPCERSRPEPSRRG